jgi:KaiC/GvpD/RAD55 family RecA-like ATPase
LSTAIAPPREVTVIDYLTGKNIRTWQAHGDEVTAWCFFCGRHNRDKGRLYINTTEGVYFCQVCQATGTFRDLLTHFGDAPDLLRPVADTVQWRRRVLDGAMDLGEKGLSQRDDVMLWLMGNDRSQKQRGLTVETILEARFGFLAKNWSLVRNLPIPDGHMHVKNTGIAYNEDVVVDGKLRHHAGDDFFRGPKVLIPYLSNGHCVQIRGRDWPEGKYQTGPDESVRLYGVDDLRGAKEVMVVEGEFDRWAVKQTLARCPEERWRNLAVVAIPGAHALPAGLGQYLSDAQKVYLGLDPDEAGQKGMIRLKEIVGPRARMVELPEDLPKCDWTEFLVYRGHGWRDIVALLQASGAEQRKLVGFSDALDSYLHREELHGAVSFGWNSIDAAIEGGGVTPGAVAVVAAKTGAGKTLIACNQIANLMKAVSSTATAVPTLFVSLEMPRADIAERLIKIWWFHNPHAEYDEMREAIEPHLMIYDRNRLGPSELLHLVDEFHEAKNCLPKLIVVDHLQYYALHQRGGSAYDRATQGIMELKEVAKEADAAMVVPTQVNRIAKDGTPIEADQMRDSGAIEETADYLLTIWRPDDALEFGAKAERSGKLQGSLAKNRRGPKGQRFNLLNALSSLAILDPSDAMACSRAAVENQQFWQGKTYEQIRAQYQQRPLMAL